MADLTAGNGRRRYGVLRMLASVDDVYARQSHKSEPVPRGAGRLDGGVIGAMTGLKIIRKLLVKFLCRCEFGS